MFQVLSYQAAQQSINVILTPRRAKLLLIQRLASTKRVNWLNHTVVDRVKVAVVKVPYMYARKPSQVVEKVQFLPMLVPNLVLVG